MVKVIQDNTTRRVVCSKCKSQLEYDCIQDPFCDDIKYNQGLRASVYSWYIRCPRCFHRIKVDERYS